MINQRHKKHQMDYIRAAVIGSALMVVLAGCSTSEVNLSYAPPGEVDRSQPKTGNLVLGHFSDRRGEDPHWVGEILGDYHYPKTILESSEPITLIVRNVVERSAQNRGLLSERGADADYQLSGEVVRLEGRTAKDTQAHAAINIRLTKPDGTKEVYRQQHHIDLNDAPTERSADKLADLLEGALNQAVAEALDAKPFRDLIEIENDA